MSNLVFIKTSNDFIIFTSNFPGFGIFLLTPKWSLERVCLYPQMIENVNVRLFEVSSSPIDMFDSLVLEFKNKNLGKYLTPQKKDFYGKINISYYLIHTKTHYHSQNTNALSHKVHPNLDLVNESIRPLLFTISRYLLNLGGV